jgi:hypothetical protein
MKDVINKLEVLSKQYPEKIKKYDPVSESQILETERLLNIKIDSQLINLYTHSDGFSFLDYCLLSIANKKIGKLINQDYYFDEGIDSSNCLVFMVTSFGSYFYLDMKEGNSVKYRDIEGDTNIKIADGFYEFVKKFVKKLEILLLNMKPNETVAYFDDDDMPQELSKW